MYNTEEIRIGIHCKAAHGIHRHELKHIVSVHHHLSELITFSLLVHNEAGEDLPIGWSEVKFWVFAKLGTNL